jgi:elongation factor Ts
MLDKITEGRMAKFYEEICLLEQPFVKEATLTVGQLVKTKIAKLGENISVARFVRFKVGDALASDADNETGSEAGIPVAPSAPAPSAAAE